MTDLLTVSEVTWPPARRWTLGPWTLRDGAGGGKRVSAATVHGQVTRGDVELAERAMRDTGQAPLFMLRADDDALDGLLMARGYAVVDPTNMWLCPIGALTDRPVPRVTAFAVWPPLAIMPEIWADGGIGPARLAVMQRAATDRTGLLGRLDDQPAGVGYCGLSDRVAMIHALEIVPGLRKRGLAGWMMRAAAFWAAERGAAKMAVLCTQANAAGSALYASLGMRCVGQYHYRQRTETAP